MLESTLQLQVYSFKCCKELACRVQERLHFVRSPGYLFSSSRDQPAETLFISTVVKGMLVEKNYGAASMVFPSTAVIIDQATG